MIISYFENYTSLEANISSSAAIIPHMFLPLRDVWSIQSTTPGHTLTPDQSTWTSFARALFPRTKQRCSSSTQKNSEHIKGIGDNGQRYQRFSDTILFH